MFFSQSKHSRNLLDKWHADSLRQPGKADDRILSMIVNSQHSLAHMNIVQLPIEYLWFSMDFDEIIEDGVFEKKHAFVTHPECLTGEDRAAAGGADSSRFPKGYDRHVTSQTRCMRSTNFYEYIFFPSKKYIRSIKPYLDGHDEGGKIKLVEYDDKYGDRNDIANVNEALSKIHCPYCDGSVEGNRVYIVHKKSIVDYARNSYENGTVEILEKRIELIPKILGHLRKGIDVVYIPEGAFPRNMNKFSAIPSDGSVQFATKNINHDDLSHYKREYFLKIDKHHPIFFSAQSRVLKHLVTMCRSIADIERVFNSSFMFLTMIRCKFW
jgi:hypothetical protein